MKKTWIIVSLATAGFAMLVLLSHQKVAAQAPPTHPGVPIGAARIHLDNSEINLEEGNIIRAFVATGSLEPECLATYNETNFAAVPNLLFCAPRFAFGQKGIVVAVFISSQPVGPFVVDVTVYQQGAMQYAPPVLCRISDGC